MKLICLFLVFLVPTLSLGQNTCEIGSSKMISDSAVRMPDGFTLITNPRLLLNKKEYFPVNTSDSSAMSLCNLLGYQVESIVEIDDHVKGTNLFTHGYVSSHQDSYSIQELIESTKADKYIYSVINTISCR